MKRFLFLASIAILLLSGCSSNEDTANSATSKEKASLTITIAGNNKTGAKAVGTPSQLEENVIYTFTVYVFENGVLEKLRTFPSSTLTQTLEGLTVGTKRVVVVANAPGTFPAFNVGDSYTRFALAESYINLDDQVSLSNGLVMTGEVNATLQSGGVTNQVSIPVSRLVAKIKLGTITLEPSQGLDPDLFILESVLIMDARSLSSVGIPSIVTTDPLYGGMQGLYVQPDGVRGYLSEPITLADHANRYFYVFADDGTAVTATMLTLVATYNGVRGYFPFVIDPIQRNTQHTLNITLRRLAGGSPGPDQPSDPAVMEVTVIPQNWDVQPTQNVIW